MKKSFHLSLLIYRPIFICLICIELELNLFDYKIFNSIFLLNIRGCLQTIISRVTYFIFVGIQTTINLLQRSLASVDKLKLCY